MELFKDLIFINQEVHYDFHLIKIFSLKKNIHNRVNIIKLMDLLEI